MFENCSQSRIVEDQRVHLSACVCVCVPKMQDMNIFSHIDSYPCQGNGVKTRTDEFKIRIEGTKNHHQNAAKPKLLDSPAAKGLTTNLAAVGLPEPAPLQLHSPWQRSPQTHRHTGLPTLCYKVESSIKMLLVLFLLPSSQLINDTISNFMFGPGCFRDKPCPSSFSGCEWKQSVGNLHK